MPKKDIDLHIEHPEFSDQKGKYVEWEDLYQGGEHMEAQAKAKAYLPQHPFETQNQYNIRLERATYRNHASPIVQVFSSSIVETPPKRELPESLEPFIEDVDRSGTTAGQFFGEVVVRAASRGVHFVLVDSPKGNAQTQAEAQQQGIRPYFVHVPAWRLIDWAFGDDGKLDFVKIIEDVEQEVDPYRGRSSQRQYKFWFRDRWEIWVEEEDENRKSLAAEMLDEGQHNLGVVPIAAFYFEQSSPMVGISSLDDVASLCRRVYMRDSELDKALFDSAVEIACFFGFSEEELEEFVRSSSNGLRTEQTEGRVEYAAPTGRVFADLRQAINEDEERIREIALRMVRPDSKQVESAESKREDRKQLNSQLARFAQFCQAGEQWCWTLAAKWMQGNDEGIEVEYNKDFDADEISDGLMRSFVDLRRNRDLSRETLWSLLQQWGYLSEDFDPEEEKQRIEAEGRTLGRLDTGGLRTTQEVQQTVR